MTYAPLVSTIVAGARLAAESTHADITAISDPEVSAGIVAVSRAGIQDMIANQLDEQGAAVLASTVAVVAFDRHMERLSTAPRYTANVVDFAACRAARVAKQEQAA